MDLNNQHVILSSDYNSLIEENNKLFIEYQELLKEYKELDEEYSQDFQEFKEEINNYIEVIEDKMTWFRENSTIINSRTQRDLRTCLECSRNECVIKIACVDVYVNRKRLDLKYDLEYKDILQDIESFKETKKGDCKEFSLIFAAQLRYLINYIKEQGKTPIIETIIKEEGATNYKIYDNWVYPEDITGYVFEADYFYPYVVCGEIYDPNKQDIGNHCLIAISDKEIKNIADIHNLDEAYLLEPQNAFFLEKIKYEDGLFYGTINNQTNIHVIIIEEDIFLNDRFVYNQDNLRWHNYKDFKVRLQEILDEQ